MGVFIGSDCSRAGIGFTLKIQTLCKDKAVVINGSTHLVVTVGPASRFLFHPYPGRVRCGYGENRLPLVMQLKLGGSLGVFS